MQLFVKQKIMIIVQVDVFKVKITHIYVSRLLCPQELIFCSTENVGKIHKRNILHSFPALDHFCPWEVAVYNSELFLLLGI